MPPWSLRRLRVPLALLAAAFLAVRAEGAGQPKETGETSLPKAVAELSSKDLDQQTNALLILALGKKGLTADDRRKLDALQSAAALQYLKSANQSYKVNNDAAAAAAAGAIAEAVQLDRKIEVPGWTTKSADRVRNQLDTEKKRPSRPPLAFSPTAFVEAVDALYRTPKEKLDLDKKDIGLAKLVLSLAVEAYRSLEEMTPTDQVEVPLRMGILWMKHKDQVEGAVPRLGFWWPIVPNAGRAREELQKALKANPEAQLPDYAQQEMGSVLEGLRSKVAFRLTPRCPDVPECPARPGCPEAPECRRPPPPICPKVPECPAKPGCPEAPGCQPPPPCPEVPGCPAKPGCPEAPGCRPPPADNWTAVGIGVGSGAAICGGVGFTILMVGSHNDEHAAYDRGDYPAYMASQSNAVLQAAIADGLYAAGAAGFIYLIFFNHPPPAADATSISLVPGPSGLVVGGSF